MSRCLTAFLSDLSQTAKQKLDLLFRLSFLEGVARKESGDWTRQPSQGAVEARSFFESQGIAVDPQWFGPLQGNPWVHELDRRAYNLSRKYENSLAAIGISQDDITADLIKAITDPTGRRQDKVFYSFGLSWKEPQKLSTTPPKAEVVIGPGLSRAIDQYIKTALSRRSNRPQLLGPSTSQLSPGGLKDPVTHEQGLERLMDTSTSIDEVDPITSLIDLMSEESGLRSSMIRLAEPAIARVTKDEVARFALRRFFEYLMDPTYNTYTPEGRDKRPNQSKMWILLSKIRDQVRADMLDQFDPDGTKTPEERDRFARRLYSILGSSGRGSGGNTDLPEKIKDVLNEIRKTPVVQKLLERYEEDRALLNIRSMTAHIVRSYQRRQIRASLGLLGVLLKHPNLWA